MKPTKLPHLVPLLLLVAAGVSLCVVPLTLIMFSGITGPFGYLAWRIVCAPAHVFGITEGLLAMSLVSGIGWAAIVGLVLGVTRGNRRPDGDDPPPAP